MTTKPHLAPALTAAEPAREAATWHLPTMLRGAGLCAAAIALMLLVGFALSRHPFGFDLPVSGALRGAGPQWLRRTVIDVTALGGGTVLTIVTLGAVAILLARRLALTAALVAAAVISGTVASNALKLVFMRPRPPLADRLIEVSGDSFPSGHAANSAIVYLTLAALVTQVTPGRATRNTVLGLAILLVGAIGTSRVYLGVHWPSDVLAGWSFGTLWAIGWWQIARR
ncbi:phosphatase PAP2 family protein, partial [Sphingomonas sp.]|uniref:phosphatase PAP2 family protein n=1 Tax=Sphingomonas sp. TaxID=28214 RepID=UPI0035C81BE4